MELKLWPENAAGAVSLSYEGGDPGHLELIAPSLLDQGIRATFYPDSESLLTFGDRWREMEAGGHEIGSGALLHLDVIPTDDRIASAAREMRSGQAVARRIFGPNHQASIALPWQSITGDAFADLKPTFKEDLTIVRSGIEGFNALPDLDPYFLRCVPCDGYTGTEMISMLENAIARKSWVIFAFAGVGSGDPGVDFAAHQHLVSHLLDRSEDLHIAPVWDIARHAQIVLPPPLRVISGEE